jgi:hypothetical protein
LVSGSEAHEVPGHHLVDVERAGLAVAHDGGGRRHERRQPLEGALGAHLLDDPDRGVGDEDAQEERVAPVAIDQGDRTEDREDQVEDREDVGPHDASIRPSRPHRGGRRPVG